MFRAFGINIEDMMKFDIMKDAKILAGRSGLKRKVTRINVMEVPDILDWVTQGELLLTTAYSIKDDLLVLKDLIPKLKKKGVAAIGIKMKRYIAELPQAVIQVANQEGFPIIEIPFKVSYTDIMMPALTEIINRQTSILIKVDEIHNRLIDVMIKGGSLDKIAEGIHKSVGNTVAIQENIFDTFVISSQLEVKNEYKRIIDEDESLVKVIEYPRDIEKFRICTDQVDTKEIRRIIYPIHGEDRHYGYLIIWEDNKHMNPMEITAIESSIPIILLDLVKKISLFEVESRHKIEFLDDLLSRDEKRFKKAIDRASLFDFDKKLGYAAMVISISNLKGFVKETLNNSSFLYRINSKVLQMIDRLTRNRQMKCVFGNKSDEIIVLYGNDRNKPWWEIKKELMQFAKEILENAAFELKDTQISIGLGRFYQSPENLWKSYQEAVKAVNNYQYSNKNLYQHYDNLGIYRVLSSDNMEEELFQFYKETLEPLVEYDQGKDSELVKTLQMYFEHGGNLKRISKEMYTHYNTIIYRMQRIKEITSMDMDNADDKLSLQVALKIYERINQSI
ncbi:PucR family transcriptional regulator [Alkaliphilus peptidifermentans]|uniref:Purine catabolism regulatory protein n=1 Tax=Alkaliphilus peptidifermentans DSM 18978 TaxID=1120976 RepID=A0A1G5ICQ9_9FIRM|nr:PucR family transcriptional regulator [Alkaliphilus peptidifermentans]SCY73470.1 purine catabolism regulatory protein [Alkaliphilus peptidifermentans DSM 18978]